MIELNNEENLIALKSIKPMFNAKRLADFLGVETHNGEPATKTITQWVREGKLPPPDLRLSIKTILWKYETIMTFVESGGYNV